jgi:hypothetical protein
VKDERDFFGFLIDDDQCRMMRQAGFEDSGPSNRRLLLDEIACRGARSASDWNTHRNEAFPARSGRFNPAGDLQSSADAP